MNSQCRSSPTSSIARALGDQVVLAANGAAALWGMTSGVAELMDQAVEEWREAVRLLDELSPQDPDHDIVQVEVVRLGVECTRMSRQREPSVEAVDACQEVIASARQVFADVRAKHPECTKSSDS